MNQKQVFIGDIRICTKYGSKEMFPGLNKIVKETKEYKKDAVLIKIKNGGFVDIDCINSITDYMDIITHKTKGGWRLGGLMMDIKPNYEGALYVDITSLKPYFENKQVNNVSIKQLKLERK